MKTLQKLQPGAAIGLSALAELPLPQLEGTPPPKLSVLKGRAEQFGLTKNASVVGNVEAELLRDPRPFHPERLFEACQSQLGTGL